MGATGSNCLVGETVLEIEDCRVAAARLGLQFHGERTDNMRPVGCYYWRSVNKVWFNTIANPSATHDIDFSARGVCVRRKSSFM